MYELNEVRIGVVGLGYVGLPLAVEFGKKYDTLGFDINDLRIEELNKGQDKTLEVSSKDLTSARNLICTNQIDELKNCNIYIITVPTPIDKFKRPDLNAISSATRSIASLLSRGDTVIYESTVYPGCTEEICVPILEEISGLVFNVDFFCGYSPERINPGDKKHTLTSIIKVTSGSNKKTANFVDNLYKTIINAGTHKAASIRIAEAAKVIENTQRDVNIALINELSIIFGRMGINTYEVLEAAGTKWNFLKFSPGLVGGHCIGVDPYYLTHKAKQLGYHAKIINSGRYVNDTMGFYVGKQTVKKILAKGKSIINSRILVMGATFKEDVSDIRNSKVIDVVKEIESYSCTVEIVDPHADSADYQEEYGYPVTEEITGTYDAVIVAVNHKEYCDLDEAYFKSIMTDVGVFVDIKGVYKNKFKDIDYWSL